MGCKAVMTRMMVNFKLSACCPFHKLRGKYDSLSSPSKKLSPFSTRHASPPEHPGTPLQQSAGASG